MEVNNLKNKTITSEITGVTVELFKEDFSEKMNFEEAVEACTRLGKGWRLPTMHELDLIYKELHAKDIENLKNPSYWSGTHHRYNGILRMNYMDFANNGFRRSCNVRIEDSEERENKAKEKAIGNSISDNEEFSEHYVRAVREVACSATAETIVDEPNISSYRIQISPGRDAGHWVDAMHDAYCYYGPEWRLPYTSELKAMHRHLKGVISGELWSDSSAGDYTAFFVDLMTGKSESEYISDYYADYGSCRKIYRLVRKIK